MADSYATVSTKATPQSKKASPKQVKNKAGGYVFKVSDETRLHRFLTIGSEGGTYYSSAAELTAENADLVINMARSGFDNKGKYLVDQIVEISVAGRAPKQNPAIFALAVAAGEGDEATRQYALLKLGVVCRTGTHLFMFLKYVQNFRGWGRALKRAVAEWYDSKPVEKLAYQALKYRSRESWTHRDVLRKAHPGKHPGLYSFITGKATEMGTLPPLVQDFQDAQYALTRMPAGVTVDKHWVDIIKRGNGLSWEMLPDDALKEARVWEALLQQGMPLGALLRQLPRLTRLGLTTGATGKLIAAQLTDPERIKRARIHPVNVLIATKTYAAGKGKGSSTWTPTGKIIDALNDMFYLAYGAVEPAGKRTLLALDCSASMGSFAGGTPITCFEAEVALSLVVMNTEPDYEIVGFSAGSGRSRGWGMGSGISRLPITPRQRLDDAVNNAKQFNWGGTDCALPMIWATENRIEVDTFITMTDNETWAGSIHPHQALEKYRQKMGIDARMVVVAFTGTLNTIADPDDSRELDVSGFDSAVPNLITDFSRGDL